MFINIKIEYSFAQSLCKTNELIEYANNKKVNQLGVVYDEFLIDAPQFILKCKENNIKPIIGVRKRIINFYNIDYITIYALNKNGILKINKLPLVIENIKSICDNDLHLVFNIQKLSLCNKLDIDDIKKNLECEKQENKLQNFNFDYNENLLALELDNFFINKMLYNEEIRFLKESDIEYFTVLNSIFKKTKYLEEKKLRDKYRPLSFEYKIKKISNLSGKVIDNTKAFIKTIQSYDLEVNFKEVLNFDEFKNINFEILLKEKLSKYLKVKINVEEEIYYKRLVEELNVIKTMQFENYFLIMEDIIKYLKLNKIPYGYGRGSAAGSLVSFLLNITLIDPIEYGLYFERFLNIKRSSLPDIDLDVSDIHRQQIIGYLVEKYGKEHVAKIFTINKYLVKSAFADISKSLDLDVNLIKKINSNLSSWRTFEENILDKYEFFNKYENDVKFDFLRETMKRIENLSRNVSIHAAGVVISNIDLESVAYLKEDVVYCEAKPLEKIGFIKFDLLALSTLSFVSRLENKIKTIDDSYKSEKIPLDYNKVYENLKEAKTLGIFQLESKGVRKVLEKYEPKTLMDIAIVIALYRPGPMQNIDLLVNNKKNQANIKYIHEDLKPILKETYGIIVFQEQIMEIVKKVASYTNAEADIFRVAISKKNLHAIEEIKKDFIEAGLKNGYSSYILNKLYEDIVKFAGYGFNKAHAISYARLIYQVMYIKSKYPTVFFAELFSSMINSSQKEEFLIELFNMHIEVFPPNVSLLLKNNILQRGKIILSINNIKNVRKNILEEILNLALGNHLKYSSDIVEFLEKVIIPLDLEDKEKKMLVGSGLFDTYGLKRKSVYLTLQKYSKIDLDILKFTKERIKIVEIEEDFEFLENAKLEKDALGFNLKYSTEEYLIRKLHKKYPQSKLTNIIYDSEDLEVMRTYFIFGQITFIKEIKTKTGKQMAFLSFKNGVKYIDITIFPDDYENLSKILFEKKGLELIVKVQKNKKGSLIFEDIIY